MKKAGAVVPPAFLIASHDAYERTARRTLYLRARQVKYPAPAFIAELSNPAKNLRPGASANHETMNH